MTFVNFQLNSLKKMEQTFLPFEALFRNYWKYHFDSVSLRFHLLIENVTNLVQIILIFFL
jgi:hypothetical protein